MKNASRKAERPISQQAPTPHSPQNACVVKIHGGSIGEGFPIAGELTLGRDANSSIFIDMADVSRRHARLFVDGGTYFVQDLDSTNGTFVNDQKIQQPQQLRHGDLIKIGGAAFKFITPGNQLAPSLTERTDSNMIRDRFETDRRVLLDLSLRNTLINHRELTSRGLRIVDELSDQLFRLLVADGRAMWATESTRSLQPSGEPPQAGAHQPGGDQSRDRGAGSCLARDRPQQNSECRLPSVGIRTGNGQDGLDR